MIRKSPVIGGKTLPKRLMNKITFFVFSFIIKLIWPNDKFFNVR